MVTFAKYLKGTSGKDTVEGTVGNDHIRGFNGNDLLWGNRAKDKVLGAAGHDTLLGGTGDDTLLGGDGNDLLIGSDDALMNPFRDKYAAEPTSKRETDNDRLIGGNGNDKIFGGKGKDFLSGGQGHDRMYGGNGSDRMLGGIGNDRMLGGKGNDIMVGNGGSDVLQGGEGYDTLRYILRQNSGVVDNYSGNRGVDTLQLEFTKAEWARADVKQDVLAFARFMAAHTDSETGQADNAFYSFNAFNLTASSFEKVKVKVNGILTPILTAEDDQFSVQEDSAPVILGSVLDNDFGAEGIEVISGPEEGTLTLDAETGEITFDTTTGFAGLGEGETREVSFDYRIFAANGSSQDATATITVHGVDDNPTGEDDRYITNENATLERDAANGLLANDIPARLGDTLSVVPMTGTTEGGADFKVKASGAFIYDAQGIANIDQLAGDQRLTDTFTYVVMDQDGDQATATATIFVNGMNDAPTLEVGSLAATEDGPSVTLDLATLGDDVDSDDTGSSLTYSVSSSPAAGTASISGTTLTFAAGRAFQDLAQGETRDVQVGITALDSHAAATISTVNVTVTGTNDAPVVAEIDAGSVTEDAAAKTINLLSGQSDVDNGTVLSAINITAVDQNGASVDFTNNGNGRISIDPSQFGALDDGQAATVTVSYNVSDGITATANTATLVVNGVTDPTTLTFDDITTNDGAIVPSGYGGLSWSGAWVLNATTYFTQDSGYFRGTTSGEYVTYNSGMLSVTDPVDEFDFVGVTLTAAWNDDLNIDVTGYRDGVELYSRTVVVSDDEPTPFTFNWEDVDRVTFQAYGGTDAGTPGGGPYLAMDDFIFI
jgi:VCBS repeat-containing protein